MANGALRREVLKPLTAGRRDAAPYNITLTPQTFRHVGKINPRGHRHPPPGTCSTIVKIRNIPTKNQYHAVGDGPFQFPWWAIVIAFVWCGGRWVWCLSA